jgi:NitT/TauT family transport system substrate-binding protein
MKMSLVSVKIVTAVVVFLVVGLVSGIFLSPVVMPPPRPEVVSIKFLLDWAVGAPNSPFIVALEKGYFAQEGLAVIMDRGYGSADTIAKVAAGAYQMGYASLDTLIEFNVKNPGKELMGVYVVLNSAPHAVFTLKGRGINSPKDLELKKIGAPEGQATRRLFPAFAKATGIDPAKIEWVSIAPALREPALVKGDVDAITAFYSDLPILITLNVDPNRIVAFKYKDYGVDLYGNTIVVRKDFMQSNPEAVKKFIKAVNRAMKEVITDPEKTVDYLKQRDPLVNKSLEIQKLRIVLGDNIVTEEVRRIGLGAVDRTRLEKTIQIIVDAFNLPRTPSPDEIFTEKFLPPKEERTI